MTTDHRDHHRDSDPVLDGIITGIGCAALVLASWVTFGVIFAAVTAGAIPHLEVVAAVLAAAAVIAATRPH